ncbi:hypothetical protein [Salinispira pacifica]|uniref:hypothetical protein n=1 Tax=Salinispira pacifica TaxID=1307761 RepID=UPI0011834C32|nr:hypothetical protein [Salinispira pacifica]
MASAVGLHAQVENIQWIPLEVPQLSREEVMWLDAATDISRNNAPMYEQALNYLAEQASEGFISAGDRISISLIKRIALSPFSRVSAGSTAHGADVQQRSQAVQILEFIGGEYSLSAADDILEMEQDPAVLRQLFRVYEEIAPPFNELRSEYFTRHLRSALLRHRDGALIDSILAAVRSMHERTWSMKSEELFEQILGVMERGTSRRQKYAALSLAELIAGIEIQKRF